MKADSQVPVKAKKKVPIFRPGGTPRSAIPRVPQFHTGIPRFPPSVSAKDTRKCRDVRRLQFDPSIKAAGPSSVSSSVCHRRLGRIDLGVKPLPVTSGFPDF
ncbi:hypothetical protein Pmani_003993 [Petrolisthes manimaculis]|uniref:Uncharacterized protein n=1 Tax=Petrolisthes manimaculis TaxID=1843537 RepID=A0AAE1UGP6_9EUCA|nr:hypothetical protein Pmani_028863 [Petrolisthes manimaculis]KAK4319611.1 hypothetical protein Pmani_009467 [Petrolisthes manimaculis]KAK4325398.1 hypothetical protein Pmani_003993 [Petrolisthes manimaculis]